MKINTSRLFIAVVLLALLSFGSVFSQAQYGKLTFNKAVNISGKQRMMGQKMCKSYIYLFENPGDIKAKKDLETSVAIFERQNDILIQNTNSKETKKLLNGVQEVWGQLSDVLLTTPYKAGAKKVILANTLLLEASNKVVESIIVESQHSIADTDNSDDLELKKTINLCGKQRMLSQRLGLYYFANQNGTKSAVTEKNLKKVYTQLDEAISSLLISNFNNEKIDEALVEAMFLWNEVRVNEDKLMKQGFENTEMYNLTNKLTRVFNKITTLYEKVKLDS